MKKLIVAAAALVGGALAAPALHLEADPCVRSEPPFIVRVAREADLVEVEGLEGVSAEQCHRLGAEATSPAVRAADDDAECGVPVDGVDRVQTGVADVLL